MTLKKSTFFYGMIDSRQRVNGRQQKLATCLHKSVASIRSEALRNRTRFHQSAVCLGLSAYYGGSLVRGK